jgi:hypothetical protein
MDRVKGTQSYYQAGTVVCSKDNTRRKLLIMRYSKGVYYCAVIGNAEQSDLPFFESQLITAFGN